MASGDKFYIADKVTLDEVKEKVGTTTDTGGSETGGSVFAKLNKIIHDVLDVLSKMGNAVDTMVGDTIFSRLNFIKSKIGKIINTEVETFIPVTEAKGVSLISDVATSSGIGSTNHLIIDERCVYFPDQSSKKIYVFDKNSLAKIGETSTQSGSSYSTVIDSDYIYYADMTAKKVIKFDKVTFAKIGETDAQTNNSVSIVVDESFIYYAEYNSTSGKLIIFDKITLAKVNEIIPTGTASHLICVDEQYLYSVNRSGSTGGFAYTVTKFNKSTLTKVKETSSRSISPNYIVMDSEYLYVAEGNSTGDAFKVVKYSKSDLSIKKETATLSEIPRTICVDNKCVYYVDTKNLKLIAFDKETLMEVNTCTVPTGSGYMAMYDEEIYSTGILSNFSGKRGIIKYKAWELYQVIGFRKE